MYSVQQVDMGPCGARVGRLRLPAPYQHAALEGSSTVVLFWLFSFSDLVVLRLVFLIMPHICSTATLHVCVCVCVCLMYDLGNTG